LNFLGIISNKIEYDELKGLIQTINLSENLHVESLQAKNILFSVAFLKNSPLKGDRLFENETWIILFAGDIVEYKTIPYEDIIEILEEKKAKAFTKFNGYFSIAAYNKTLNKLFIISDRFSQHPIYYSINDNNVYFSTEMSTFCRLNKKFKFNEEWLWEYLFFNFPIGDTTILESVKRMPPASIIEYNHNSGKYYKFEYAKVFERKDNLLGGNEALELSSEIFANRIPKYFEGASEVACALTNGWDGRIVLALAPNCDITAYTYGMPNCGDIKGAKKTAEILNIKHRVITFNEEFIRDLPNYMLETVFLSSGLEKVLRATLLYIYGKLTDYGKIFPLTTSGIALGGIFRGHMLSPEIISFDLASMFKGNKTDIRKGFWSSVFKTDYSLFEEYIMQKLKYLQNIFGDFKAPDHHLSYLIYFVFPKHFCGEMKIASNFTTLRVPSWDSEVIDLSYSIKQSALSFSEYSGHVRGGRDEVLLQSYLLSKLSPRFAKIPVQNTRPDVALRGDVSYQFYRIIKGLRNRISYIVFPKTRTVSLDEWDVWINNTHKEFIDGLIFSKDSEVRKYFKSEYLEKLKKNRTLQNIGKLASSEIILRLVKNNWKRFW